MKLFFTMGWALTADNITDIGAISVAHLKCEGFQTSPKASPWCFTSQFIISAQAFLLLYLVTESNFESYINEKWPVFVEIGTYNSLGGASRELKVEKLSKSLKPNSSQELAIFVV